MSFLFELENPREEASAAFIADVGRKLQRALERRKSCEPITQQELARRLDIDRSRVNKCFSGHANLTLKTLSELVWAMDGKIDFDIMIEDPAKECINIVDKCSARHVFEDAEENGADATRSQSNSAFFRYQTYA